MTHPIEQAADWLRRRHEQHAGYEPLPAPLLPPTVAAAYDVQDALVRAWCAAGDAVAGHKIALTTPQMRRFVGFDDSIAGQVLASRVHASPARIARDRAVRLGFECEIAFRIGRAIAPGAAPATRAAVAAHIDAIAPAFELVDDGAADYARFAQDGGATLRTLAADNAWNHGVVLGDWVQDWRGVDLDALEGVAAADGAEIGRGHGRDVLGHPLDAMVWMVRHLAARGRGLPAGAFVITGSLVTTRFPSAGETDEFTLAGVGTARMQIV
ncbi:MAG: fumarylacetoacetate hydrolase family protein [Burkholderiales bacterium]|nr:fumarylacetoacetate hydrolase family protein [Burkholderiales bacterium]